MNKGECSPQVIERLTESLIKEVVEGIAHHYYCHNRSVSKGNGGEYVDVEQETRTAVDLLKDRLIRLSLED